MKALIKIPAGANIDPYLRAHRRNTTFELGPGLHWTDGHFAFADHGYCSLGDGCELIGAGPAETALLYGGAVRPPAGAAQVEILTAGGGLSATAPGVAQSVRIEGLEVACPDDAMAALKLPACVGIHTAAARAVVRDVVITGVRGKRNAAAPGVSSEGFGLLVNRSHGSSAPGRAPACIERVRVELADTDVEENYVCGVYVGIVGTQYAPARVDDVHVTTIEGTRTKGHAAIGTNGGVIWSRVSMSPGFHRAIFCDTGDGSDTLFDACNLRAMYAALDLRTSAPAGRWENIRVVNSTITLDPGADSDHAALITLAAHPEAAPGHVAFRGVMLRECFIRNNTGLRVYQGSVDAPAAKSNGLIDNVYSGPTHLWRDPVFTPRLSSSWQAWRFEPAAFAID